MRIKADMGASKNSGGPGDLGESGILIWRAHMIIPEGVLAVEVRSWPDGR
jgi:hypothetical protein